MRTFYRSIPFTAAVWLIARLLLAYEFLPAGLEKVLGEGSAAWVGPQAGAPVAGFLQGALAKMGGEHPSVYSWYGWLIQHAFLPNAALFSYLVAFGEVLVGLALVLGVCTRFATSMALLMSMAYFYAGTVSSLPYVLPLEMAIVFAGAYAGHYGLDGMLLARHLPWFRTPGEGEPPSGAAALWERIIPALVLAWILLLLVAILGR